MSNTTEVYVVGNGPSLKKDIIKALSGRTWLGMNSAYRYWREINVYPTYYACLDPVVVESHASEIHKLIHDGKIEKFFLHQQFRAIFPDLVSEQVVYLDEFLSKDKSLPFSKLSLDKQTTGVLALRFVIEMDYENITLVGIDCNYVEEIKGAKSVKGYELEIAHQYDSNPNYFFEGYQTKGDRYQIPNPVVHSGNLHLQSFISFRNDLFCSVKLDKIDVQVASKESLLYKYGIFEKIDIYRKLGIRKLSCIMIPVLSTEITKVIDLINLWSSPKLAPSLFKQDMRIEALNICIALDYRKDIEEEIRRSLTDKGTIFKNLGIYFLGEQDLDAQNQGKFILSCLERCSDYDYTLQFPSDCIPIKPGWLDRVEQKLLDADSKILIVPLEKIDQLSMYVYHKNNIAVYSSGMMKLLKEITTEPICLSDKLDCQVGNLTVSNSDLKEKHLEPSEISMLYPDAWFSKANLLNQDFKLCLNRMPSFFNGSADYSELSILGVSSDENNVRVSYCGFGILTIDKIKNHDKVNFIVYLSGISAPNVASDTDFTLSIKVSSYSSSSPLINAIKMRGYFSNMKSAPIEIELITEEDGSTLVKASVKPQEFIAFRIDVNLGGILQEMDDIYLNAQCYRTQTEYLTKVSVYAEE